jgi:CubicO group peptidase (beta-lactamase class C family)
VPSQVLRPFQPFLRLRVSVLAIVCVMWGTRAQGQMAGAIADSFQTFLTQENTGRFLGLGVAITEQGKPDYKAAFGWADNGLERPFTDSTLFNLGSVSKLFTAIAIVKLVDEGILKLDDPVYLYFPEFLQIQGRNRDAPKITLAHLLQHRSGIHQSMEDLFPEKFAKESLSSEEQYYENTYNYRAFLNREDFKSRFLMYARLEGKPGKQYQFSNLGYVILGYILEEVTGLNVAQFVTNNVFVPLGMEDSHYYITPDSMTDRLAWGYYRLHDGSYFNVHDNEVESPSPTGDGGIKTSMRDMTKFMNFLLGDYQRSTYDSILARPALLQMMAPMEKGPDKQTWVGLGFHNLQPHNFAGHAGGWDGFLTILYFHPESHSCLFLATNREDNDLFKFLWVYAAYAMLRADN